MIDCIEQGHPKNAIDHRKQQREPGVYSPQKPSGRRDTGGEAVGRDPRCLGAEELSPTHTDEGKDGDAKHDDSHTTHPVGDAPPEQYAARQLFDGGKNRRTSRREAGDGLEQRRRRCWGDIRQQERDAARQHDSQPSEADHREPLARVYRHPPWRETP